MGDPAGLNLNSFYGAVYYPADLSFQQPAGNAAAFGTTITGYHLTSRARTCAGYFRIAARRTACRAACPSPTHD